MPRPATRSSSPSPATARRSPSPRAARARRTARTRVFLLSGYATKGPASKERIVDDEIFAWLKKADDKGVNVVFIADSCHSGTMNRSVRNEVVRYRKADFGAITDDELEFPPPATAKLTEGELKHVTFISATTDEKLTPEVKIDGKWRGALELVDGARHRGPCRPRRQWRGRSVRTRRLHRPFRRELGSKASRRRKWCRCGRSEWRCSRSIRTRPPSSSSPRPRRGTRRARGRAGSAESRGRGRRRGGAPRASPSPRSSPTRRRPTSSGTASRGQGRAPDRRRGGERRRRGGHQADHCQVRRAEMAEGQCRAIDPSMRG